MSLFQNQVALALSVALLVVGAGSLVGQGTRAIFTDTATSTGNTFTAGTVSLVVSDADQTDLETVNASITGSNLAPGNLVTGFIDVRNNGSLALRYAVSTTVTSSSSTANDAMRDALTVGVDTRALGTACTSTQGGTGQTQVIAAGTALKTLAIGNPAQGAQSGDRDLASGAGERLCFYVTLPSATGDSAQGGTATFTFTFYAEQTTNNP